MSQKGAVPLPILIAGIGLLSLMAVFTYAPLKNQLASIFPKDQSQAAETSFTENFTGFPPNPLPWNPANWDVSQHMRETNFLVTNHPMEAHHGADCSKPVNDINPGNPTLVTHQLTGNYPDYVFQCRDHVMTSAFGPDYAMTYLTPNHMIDFSNGEAVIRWDMDTLRTSGRDWTDIWITPYEDNLQLPLQSDLPDVQGPPRNAIMVKMDLGLEGKFRPTIWRNFTDSGEFRPFSSDYDSFLDYRSLLTPSAARRDTFELRISKTHLKFCLLTANYSAANVGPNGETTPKQINACWVDKNITTLPFDKGIVQFGHHSYNPQKDCEPTSPCLPNTWHWDTVSMSPTIPFTMIKPDKRIIMKDDVNKTVTFASPAPANSFLRFSALGRIEISFNNGTTWQVAQRQPVQPVPAYHPEHFSSYFIPIPQGTQSVQVRFSADDWYNTGFGMAFRDPAIWSLTTPTVSPSPSPIPSPSPLPSATPSPSPAASSKPGDIVAPIGTVDIFDYNQLLTDFGKTGTNLISDIEKSGASLNKVDIFDYNLLLTNFGR